MVSRSGPFGRKSRRRGVSEKRRSRSMNSSGVSVYVCACACGLGGKEGPGIQAGRARAFKSRGGVGPYRRGFLDCKIPRGSAFFWGMLPGVLAGLSMRTSPREPNFSRICRGKKFAFNYAVLVIIFGDLCCTRNIVYRGVALLISWKFVSYAFVPALIFSMPFREYE